MKLNKRIAGAMVGVGLLVGILGSGVVLAQPSTHTSGATEIHEDHGAGDQDDVQVEDVNETDDVLETADKVEDDLEAGDQDDVQEEHGWQADDASENSGVKIEDD